MLSSWTVQPSASAVLTAISTASPLMTGSEPGSPRQTGQTLVFGGCPKCVLQPQKSLVFVSSCAWTSSPITTSYSVTVRHYSSRFKALYDSQIFSQGGWEDGRSARREFWAPRHVPMIPQKHVSALHRSMSSRRNRAPLRSQRRAPLRPRNLADLPSSRPPCKIRETYGDGWCRPVSVRAVDAGVAFFAG